MGSAYRSRGITDWKARGAGIDRRFAGESPLL